MRTVPTRSAWRPLVVLSMLCLVGTNAPSQQQQQSNSQGNRAIQLPASGRSQAQAAGNVLIEQSTSQGSTPGQPVISNLIVVTGNYQGSVNGNPLPPGVLHLTISDAVKRGLLTNLGALTSGNEATAAAAQRLQAFSALMPQVTATLSGTETQINLAKSGLSALASSPIQIPLVIGPFHYVDGQANLDWNAFSLTAIRNYRAQRKVEQASGFDAQDARELVVLAVGGSYLQLVSSAARIESEKLLVKYDQASYDQIKAQLEAGTEIEVNVTRTLVQLETEQERLISLQGDFDQKRVAFCRLIGVTQDRDFALAQPSVDINEPAPDEMSRMRNAFDHRRDLKAAFSQVRAAELSVGAARAERIPALSVNGFYGVDGPTPNKSHGVFTATAQVTIPIFDGGKIRADVRQALSTLHQRQAEYEDTKSKVEQDVRDALIQLRTAAGQLKLAKSSRKSALESLRYSQDRLAAGVTTSVEVVQAEQQLSGAETDYISSLFSLNLARLYLARATGSAEADLDPLFGIHK